VLAAQESGTSSEEDLDPNEAAADFVRAVVRAATADVKIK
jgi:hypothetical protein